MNINWFEIVAQMINFIILLFILHKLFYKPVVKAMAEREQRIFHEQNEAADQMKHANELITTYENRIAEIKVEEKNILETAKQEANDKKELLMDDYRKEAQLKGTEYLNEIEEAKEEFLKDLRKSLGKNALKVASNVLSIISADSLKDKIFESFIEKIESLDQESLKNENESAQKELILLCSEHMSSEDRQLLEKKLHEKIGAFNGISYRLEEDLVLGYTLELNTITVHTNIKKYLDEAEKNIMEKLEKKPF